jgi:hypothetical protein
MKINKIYLERVSQMRFLIVITKYIFNFINVVAVRERYRHRWRCPALLLHASVFSHCVIK